MTATKTTPPEEDPARTPERNVEAAVEGSFPASDPASATASQGARAVSPERLMEGHADRSAPQGAITLSLRFKDGEAAKLALETLVREGPVDRRCAEIEEKGAGATLALRVPPGDAERLRGLAARQGGAVSAG